MTQTPDYPPESDLLPRWASLIKGFAARGATFVPLDRFSRGSGLRKSWNEPANTLQRADALKTLKAGRNIGLGCPSGNVYCFDFDAGAERGHECAQLGGTIYTYRPNAAHRAKFFFTCKEKLPKRSEINGVGLQGWTTTGRYTNAVIAGYHNSGAPILWGGVQLVELDGETAAALWEEFTGRPLWSPGGSQAAVDDLSADFAFDAAATADDLLAAAIERAAASGRNNTGFQLACALRDRRLQREQALVVMRTYQQAVTTRDNPYTLHEAQVSLHSAYAQPPRALRSESARPNRAEVEAQLLRFRDWLHSETGLAWLRDAGFRQPEGVRELLDALARICARWGSLSVAPGVRALADEVNASTATISRRLRRLIDAQLVTIDYGDGATAATISLNLALVFATCNTNLDPVSSPPIDDANGPSTAYCYTLRKLDFYSENRPRDAFLNNHYVYKLRRPDGIAPLGATALPVLAHLLVLVAASGTALVASGAGSYAAVMAGLRRLHEYGLVEYEVGHRNRKTWRIVEGALERLPALETKMTTYLVRLDRGRKSDDARAKYAAERGNVERAERLRADAQRKLDTWNALKSAVGGFVDLPPRIDKRKQHHEALRHTARRFDDHLDEQKRFRKELIRKGIPRQEWVHYRRQVRDYDAQQESAA